MTSKKSNAEQPTTSQAAQPRKTGTRDAVEKAIELAKSDNSLTWEQQLAKEPRRISPWTEPQVEH